MTDDDSPSLARLLRRAGSRRDFLAHAARASSAVMLGPLVARRDDPIWRRAAANPFTLGVASGDPTPTGVVLWTRLAPDPMHGGGMPPERVRVRWEMARDDSFRRIVRTGDALAVPELAHSVHAEVDGLEPGRDYFYRFVAGGEASPIARTRTAPAPGALPDALRFAVICCQNWQEGYWTALRHAAAEDVDLMVHLGDYIYEHGIREKIVRPHDGPEVFTLDAYRARHALYRSDADLRAAHARAPWIVTWDDHDVANNYASAHSPRGDPVDAFLARRAAAYQAYYEHLPLRLPQRPHGPDARMYRRMRYGALATFHVLDTRQYRSIQPCGGASREPRCAEASDPARTMLGEAQERWLFDGLASSDARWNLIANQVPFSQVDQDPGPDVVVGVDRWDGYVSARRRVLDFLAERRPRNPVILTGDAHFNLAMNVKADFDDPASPTIAAEMVCTSISSGFDGQDLPRWGETILAASPHARFLNQQRGYIHCTVSRGRMTSDYRVVPYVSRPGAPIATRATMVVEDGRPGLERA